MQPVAASPNDSCDCPIITLILVGFAVAVPALLCLHVTLSTNEESFCFVFLTTNRFHGSDDGHTFLHLQSTLHPVLRPCTRWSSWYAIAHRLDRSCTEFYAVTDQGRSLLPVFSNDCPSEICPVCNKAPLAFVSHQFCFNFLPNRRNDTQRLDSASITEVATRFWNLGQALLPLSPSVTGPHENGIELEVLKSSFCQANLSRIPSTCQRTNDCSYLLHRLTLLPDEILEHVASFLTPCFFQKLSVIFGDTLNLLMELETNPARKISLSSQDAIFATQIRFGDIIYISGLYNESVNNSSLVKAVAEQFKFAVVWLNTIGITRVEFHSSIDSITSWQSDREWVYAIFLSDTLHIRSKVMLLYI